MRLVTQAGYEGDAKDRVLRDTIISGLTSDKIRAKIVKEGHGVNLKRVMEIARLEVSTQQHLERMQETAKVNYVQYGKSTKSKKGKKPQSGAGASGHNAGASGPGQAATGDPGPVENSTKDLHCHQTSATDVGKEDTKRHRTAKLWTLHAEDVERKDIMRRFASKENALHTLWKFHRPTLQGQGPVNPFTSMMRENQCTLIWSVSPM